MKKILFVKPMYVMVVVASLIVILFSNCKKNNKDELKKSYSNMDDKTTTSIKLTIPRIELSSLKSTDIKLYLSVTDQDGNPLKHFNQYNFEIKQVCTGETDTTLIGSISLTELNEEGSNIAVSSTLDYSGSMSDSDKDNMEQAVKSFVNLKENDDYMEIIKFASEINVVAEFTNNTDVLINAVDNIPYQGGESTAFYDAVNRGIVDGDQFFELHQEYLPAVLGFTDGGDNESQLTINNIINEAQIKQVPVYTIGFGDPNTSDMNLLADKTGGRYYYTPDANEVAEIYSLISGQLKNLYLVEWSYDNPGCDEVTVVVKSSYSCANGDFVSFATKQFLPLNK